MAMPAYFLRRIAIENYKSIGRCSVELRPLTLVVGKNGAGKSNFFDALRFIAEGLQTSLGSAIKSRGGIHALLRKGADPSNILAIELEISLPDSCVGIFGVRLALLDQGGFAIDREYVRVLSKADNVGSYSIEKAKVVMSSIESPPPAFPDRFYLASASGFPIFRPLYDALSSMSLYELNPDAMRQLQPHEVSEHLRRDGSNVASVLAQLSDKKPEIVDRINSYLSIIVPGLQGVDRVTFGPMETLRFRQPTSGSNDWQFYAPSMSDGTLRALGILIAVGQQGGRTEPTSLVGIEEPETALHPAAAGALMDALREASTHTQVLVTSHSPDLLDQIDLAVDGLLVVQWQDGETKIAPANPASRRAIRDHLYTAGELLRMDQLEPDFSDLEKQEQMHLFSSAGKA